MSAATCPTCGAMLRPQSRYCPQCSSPVPVQPMPMGGPSVGAIPRPPSAVPRPPMGAPARGTFIKSEPRQRPGTLLYQEQSRPQVLGWILILKGKRRGSDFRISSESMYIGRDGSCDVALDDETASRKHALIRYSSEGFVLVDLGSANGTFLNRRRAQHENLDDGDVIRVGETLLLFKQAVPGPQWKSDSGHSEDDDGEEKA